MGAHDLLTWADIAATATVVAGACWLLVRAVRRPACEECAAPPTSAAAVQVATEHLSLGRRRQAP